MIDSSTIYGDLNNPSNANPGNKLVNIAKGELGNREVGDTNINKYGEWYGDNGVPWCAQFVSWCANEAEILGTVVPRYEGCYAGMQWYAARGRLHYVKDNYQPMRGDVFFKSSQRYPNGGGHTGIVTGYDPYTGMVYTIEGNSGNRVCYNKRFIGDFYAFGDNYGDQFGPPNPNAEPGGSVV